jgi:hypothetical protein
MKKRRSTTTHIISARGAAIDRKNASYYLRFQVMQTPREIIHAEAHQTVAVRLFA